MGLISKRKRRLSEGPESPPISTGKRLVNLNVSDLESSDFIVRKRLVFDFTLVTFRPVENVLVDKVVLKDTVFWHKGHANDECTCLRSYTKGREILFLELVIRKGENTTFEYFYRDYYKWVSTNPTVYSHTFSKLVDLFYLRATPKLNINGKVNPTFFYENRIADGRVNVITPKPGVWVDRVVDGVVDIWEKNYKTEICVNAVVFHTSGKPSHVFLLVNEIDAPKQEIYFRKDGISWPRITREQYLEALLSAGLDPKTFSNKIDLDLRKVDDKFEKESFDLEHISATKIAPLNGLKVSRVLDGDSVLWEHPRNFITCANHTKYKDKYSLLTLFERNSPTASNATTKLLYFLEERGKWSQIDRNKYDHLYSVRDNKFNTHLKVGLDKRGDRKLLMSHFRNKYGLKINTFCSPVDNSKGSMVLVHGAYGHFLSDYASYSDDFPLQYENYKPVVDLVTLDHADYDCMDSKKYVLDNLLAHKDIFEYRDLDGLDMFETGDRFEYKRSFIEALNNMGYTVYGLDLPSHGHSESLTHTRFYTSSFSDYVDDLLQFILIVKKGLFFSPEGSDADSMFVQDGKLVLNTDDLASENGEGDPKGKFYLVGYSMGSNVCLRAVNEYYKRTHSGKKLLDGLVCLSGMYQLAEISSMIMQRLAAFLISFLSFFAPKAPNALESLFDFTRTHDTFSRFRDPMYSTKKMTNKTLLMVAKATFDLPRNLTHLPEYLPILLLNAVEDDLVNIEGARKVHKLLKNSKLVELNGNVHGLPLSQFVTVVTPLLKDWLSSLQ